MAQLPISALQFGATRHARGVAAVTVALVALACWVSAFGSTSWASDSAWRLTDVESLAACNPVVEVVRAIDSSSDATAIAEPRTRTSDPALFADEHTYQSCHRHTQSPIQPRAPPLAVVR